MWYVAKALNLSPFDEKISSLTPAQIQWVLANHYQDIENELETTKMVCRFINPQLAQNIFDVKHEVTVGDMDEILEDINKYGKSKIDASTLQQLFKDPNALSSEPDIDIIERVD